MMSALSRFIKVTSESNAFSGPYGSNEIDWNKVVVGHWSAGEETCCLCGTYYPDDCECHVMEWLGGGEHVVLECCGRFIDDMYWRFGMMFAKMILEEFGEDPAAKRFADFRHYLTKDLRSGLVKVDEAFKSISGNASRAGAIEEIIGMIEGKEA